MSVPLNSDDHYCLMSQIKYRHFHLLVYCHWQMHRVMFLLNELCLVKNVDYSAMMGDVFFCFDELSCIYYYGLVGDECSDYFHWD